MPGQHAPENPRSFYLSLARSLGGALAVVVMVIVVAIVAVSSGGGGGGKPQAGRTPSPTPTPSDSLIPESPVPSFTPSIVPSVSETPLAERSPDPAPTTLPPDQVSVEVLNGTRRAGLAKKVADRLREAGYNVIDTGNANRAKESTIIHVPGAADEAAELQRRFPEFGIIKEGRSTQPVILRLIIGDDYP